MDLITVLLEPACSVHSSQHTRKICGNCGAVPTRTTTHGRDAHDAHNTLNGNAHNHKAHPPPLSSPPSAHHRGPAVSCALRARARETATTTRDASRRLVVFTPPSAAAIFYPQHPPQARRLAPAASP
ncbi:hypothetical protein PLICRDRAFT_180984 [Plicaturopsis crispa FD-325 SS-3]|uniref:Uncharacterized protein n=1 Tax=Plicaturopsis crispa FD-325 SS-3 TaxID=944288 RepID=A0A0C9SV60_PLICR|nr:hypothetical protein PLICRDRAFT_180984 [Plicaturopsis crispa FD-325 SS-3]